MRRGCWRLEAFGLEAVRAGEGSACVGSETPASQSALAPCAGARRVVVVGGRELAAFEQCVCVL